MKKLLVLVLVCMFTVNFVAFEAVGKTKGIKRSFSKPPQQSTTYKAPAERIDAAKNVKKPSTTQQSSGSNFLRNAGMLAGGMMLGSMLATLFGGSGMLASIFGMLFNLIFLVLILGALFVAGRFLWRKIRGDHQQNNHNQWNRYKR